MLRLIKRIPMISIFLLTIFIALGFNGLDDANAAAPANGETYIIVNRNSGLVLEVVDALQDNGANVQQWVENGHDCQQWRLEATDNGHYHVVNMNSGKFLEVDSASTEPGANVQQYGPTNHACQEWSFQSAGDGYYFLVNRNSEMVADVWEWSTEIGGNIAQWTNTGGENQQWMLVETSISPPTGSVVTERHYLSGTGKDNTVNWDFFCSSGRNSGFWTTIPVPSCWETEGFGTYEYGGYSTTEQGKYRHNFDVPSSWIDKEVYIVFDGSMTDTQVWINGVSAGQKHQGAFYRFKYNITELLNYGGSNLLEVTVDKKSSNTSVNEAERQADYWVFGGIYRPVFLEAYPAQFIERVAIDAKASGAFNIDVYLKNIASATTVECQIRDLNGTDVGSPFSASVSIAQGSVRLSTTINNPDLWDAENPNLYKVLVKLNSGGNVLHSIEKRFGFRTIEVRAYDGIYINGNKIMLKGVNRHSFHPDSGRTLNSQIHLEDVNTIKEMNMNAVRMSHYPPDESFLDYCDEKGLYVLDELAGWQDCYDTQAGTILAKEMVDRDVNHPSVIFWDNSNEINLSGTDWNHDLTYVIQDRDPQGRKIIYPRGIHDNMDTLHYPSYSTLESRLSGNYIYFPTEFLHGLYDGGHGAGLNDYWNLMKSKPMSAGGFLWVYADEGVNRSDTGQIDTDGNHAPDGILGPYHEKEGSFYTIKEIWSPVQLTNEYYYQRDFPANFNGNVGLTNYYDHTNTDQCTFSWELVNYREPNDSSSGYTVLDSGNPASPDIAPGESGYLVLNLPGNWSDYDALFVNAKDKAGSALWTWKWNIKKAVDHKNSIVNAGTGTTGRNEDSSYIYLTANGMELQFNKSNGLLNNVQRNGNTISFNNGPKLTSGTQSLSSYNISQSGNNSVVQFNYTGNLNYVRWTIMPSGWVEMDYQYNLSGNYNHMGVSFDYPETRLSGMKWLGKGPYRVWKNRLKGVTYNVWEKDYNNTVTGSTETYKDYPEFKGYYSEMYWAKIKTDQGDILVANDSEHLFLRMYTPTDPPDAANTAIASRFPTGNISFLDGIDAIGTKFINYSDLGAESQKNSCSGNYSRKIYFLF